MNEQEFTQQLLALQPELRSYCLYITWRVLRNNSIWTADDLFQEGIYRALKYREMFAEVGEAALLRWCKTMIRRMAYDRVGLSQERWSKAVDTLSLVLLQDRQQGLNARDEIADRIHTAEQIKRMYKAIEAKLGPDEAVCVLYSLEERPTADVSKDLGITDALYRWKTFKARQHLKVHLQEN